MHGVKLKKTTLASKKKNVEACRNDFLLFNFWRAKIIYDRLIGILKITIGPLVLIGNIHKTSVAGFRRYNIRFFHIGNVNQNGGDGSLWTRHLFSGLME